MAKLRIKEELQQKRHDVRATNIAGRIQNLATQIYASRDVSIDEAWRLAKGFMSSVAERTKAVYEELKAPEEVVHRHRPWYTHRKSAPCRCSMCKNSDADVIRLTHPPGSKLRYCDGRIAVVEGIETQYAGPIRAHWEADPGYVIGICWPIAEYWTRIS